MSAHSLVTLCCLCVPLFATDPDPELPLHEKALKEAGVPLDSPSLLKLFRDRTPSSQDRARLTEMVRNLGVRSFALRNKAEQDLIRAGKLAVPLLKPALRDSDIEIVRRAERCMAAIESNSDAPLLTSAACVLANRRPAQTVETLLGYLPTANDEYVIESVHGALIAVGVEGDQPSPALIAAIKDTEASRRLAAATALGKTNEKQRQLLRPLLADPDGEVRLMAAASLFRIGDREAGLVLMRMLTDSPAELAAQAEEVLCQAAGDRALTTGLGGDENTRRECRAAWEKWWKKSSDEIDWKALNLDQPALGLTLVCEAHLADGGRVFECGRDGKARWTVKCNNPVDAQLLPGNRVLIADCNGNKVMEVDRNGKELWTHSCSTPICVQRLPNGNTLIASHSDIREVTRDGTIAYSFGRTGQIYYARKLKNGTIVVVTGDGVLAELDVAGKEKLRLTIGGMSNWAGVEALPGGRFLVARSGANEVVEVDRTGKVLWKIAVRNPNSAVRLPNGHTLVASHDDKYVYEFGRDGKEVWKRQVEGSPFRARRR